MPARLELEARERALADQARDHLLVAAELGHALRDDLDLPALALGIARVHAEEVAGEQRRLVAAGPCAHLEKQVAIVVRIARQQRLLQLRFELLHRRARFLELLIGVDLHRGLRRHVARLASVALRLQVVLEQGDDVGHLGVLARQALELLHVLGGVLRRQQVVQVAEPPDQAVELDAQARIHCGGLTGLFSGGPASRRAPASGRAAACWSASATALPAPWPGLRRGRAP